MLVLNRRVDESIVIGDNIRVTVANIERGQVTLGIEAPREIPIMREELVKPAAPLAEDGA